MKRRTKVLLAGSSFGLVVASAIFFATGSAHVGLHAAFWITIVFTVWVESRIPE